VPERECRRQLLRQDDRISLTVVLRIARGCRRQASRAAARRDGDLAVLQIYRGWRSTARRRRSARPRIVVPWRLIVWMMSRLVGRRPAKPHPYGLVHQQQAGSRTSGAANRQHLLPPADSVPAFLLRRSFSSRKQLVDPSTSRPISPAGAAPDEPSPSPVSPHRHPAEDAAGPGHQGDAARTNLAGGQPSSRRPSNSTVRVRPGRGREWSSVG